MYEHHKCGKRHFFLFPKEHDRWLAWVQACKRLDLIPKGPEYAHRNCRLCHVHFEENQYKIVKSRARLHPDAVPTRCLEFTNNKAVYYSFYGINRCSINGK
ncbi:52 kDa repressor of the inhibitor of the protein kinase-like [Temnothorax americanus]|uniref:52 kDa repressor of the inhibitor of the protein kinase-like n=1 Tax=Temnothorax americanus TaxID=1964332 RepID=UPI00406984A4